MWVFSFTGNSLPDTGAYWNLLAYSSLTHALWQLGRITLYRYLYAAKSSSFNLYLIYIITGFIVLDVLQEPYNYLIYISTNGLLFISLDVK